MPGEFRKVLIWAPIVYREHWPTKYWCLLACGHSIVIDNPTPRDDDGGGRAVMVAPLRWMPCEVPDCREALSDDDAIALYRTLRER